jgi:hypothetical protein
MLRRFWLSTDKGILILLILSLLAFLLLFKPWIHGTDPTGYYSWLRSVVVDGDLDTADEYAHLGQGHVGSTTTTGHRDNPYAIGSAILWAPFFLVAHGLTLGGQALGFPLISDGYSPQYIVAISLGSVAYAFTGLLLVYYTAREFFTFSIVTLAVASVWLASPLVFYQYSHPAMSHANDAFAYALFLFAWHKTRGRRTPVQYILLGAVTGLAALVRTQNGLLVLSPVIEIAIDSARRYQKGEGKKAILSGAVGAFAFSLAWWLAFLPQMAVWRTVFGEWWPGNPYTRTGGGAFDFSHPYILEVLFSTNHGLFVWTPLMLPAVLGWFPLWQRDRRLTALLALNLALQLYVVASWSSWDGSAAFGQRFFTNMVPAFALGLAALLNTMQSRIPLRWLVMACGFFVAWNGLLLIRYVLGDVPRFGGIPLEQLILGQFTIIPRYLGRIVQVLITRE